MSLAVVFYVFFALGIICAVAQRRQPPVDRLRREAERKDKRAMTMSKKLVGGNMRARSAATTAENLHNQADRLAVAEAARRQTAAEAEARRLEIRRENFRRTGSYNG